MSWDQHARVPSAMVKRGYVLPMECIGFQGGHRSGRPLRAVINEGKPGRNGDAIPQARMRRVRLHSRIR